MRKAILLFIVLIILIAAKAQNDIIYKTDRSEIKCKVVEITEQNTVKYKEADNMDGPLLNIKTEQIFMIQYANGKNWKPETTTVTQSNTTANAVDNNNNNIVTPIATTVTDIDGNIYNVVKIGNQYWMKENLKNTRFQDGTAIIEIEDFQNWKNNFQQKLTTPAWCYPMGEDAKNAVYGKLYNWYVAADQRNVCPVGWHVPTDLDFLTMLNAIGGSEHGGALKTTTPDWDSPTEEATNSSGFSALPAGWRYMFGKFTNYGLSAHFLTASDLAGSIRVYAVGRDFSNVKSYDGFKGMGASIRCLKNQ